LDIPTSFYKFLKFETIEKHLKTAAQYWAETGLRLQATGHGGLLHVIGRKAGWGTA
jgi:hypothetical protein